jgi:DNA-binding MarR family transcriptional regulator
VNLEPRADRRTDASPRTADAQARALRATRAVTVFSNLISTPFYVNSQVPFGVSLPEWRALREIHLHPGITQTEIAERTAQHIMTLSRAVRQLTTKGLIEGRVDPEDRRRTQLFATDTGAEMAAEMERREAVQVSHIMSGITETEADELIRIVDKLIHHVRTTERPVPPPVSRDWRAIVESAAADRRAGEQARRAAG